MTWTGGSWGKPGMNREQFRAWLRAQQKPSFVSFLVVHETDAQFTLASVGGQQRMRNLEHYYRDEKKWRGGPPLFCMGDGLVYPGSPIWLQSVHSPSWNKISIGTEAEGRYNGTRHFPDHGSGAVVWDAMAWCFAEQLMWFGFQPTDKYVRLHRQDPRTTHACPGKLIQLPWFLDKVKRAWVADPGGVTVKPYVPPPAVMPIETVRPKLKVYEPGKFRYSDEWCVPMMKRIEGLRLVAYPDPPGWSIGYGHCSTSGVKPITKEGMKLENEAAAEQLLRIDLDECVRYLNAWVKVRLDQGMVDALCVHIFQQGPTQFRNNLLELVNSKMHWTVAKKIEGMPHAKAGVVRRRKLEAERYRGNSPTKW